MNVSLSDNCVIIDGVDLRPTLSEVEYERVAIDI